MAWTLRFKDQTQNLLILSPSTNCLSCVSWRPLPSQQLSNWTSLNEAEWIWAVPLGFYAVITLCSFFSNPSKRFTLKRFWSSLLFFIFAFVDVWWEDLQVQTRCFDGGRGALKRLTCVSDCGALISAVELHHIPAAHSSNAKEIKTLHRAVWK